MSEANDSRGAGGANDSSGVGEAGRVVIEADGGSRGNPGPAAIGYRIEDG